MGKTPKPLRVLVLDPCCGWEEWAGYQAQGHVIDFASNDYDLIVGGVAWRMDEQHRKYLDLAISEARRRRYPTKDKEAS